MQPAAHGVAATRQHQRVEVGPQRAIRQHGGVEALPQFGHQLGLVLDQLQLRRDALGLQERQRRGAQQLRKPGVKSANLHPAPSLQQLLLQARQQRFGRAGLGRAHASVDQRLNALVH